MQINLSRLIELLEQSITKGRNDWEQEGANIFTRRFIRILKELEKENG